MNCKCQNKLTFPCPFNKKETARVDFLEEAWSQKEIQPILHLDLTALPRLQSKTLQSNNSFIYLKTVTMPKVTVRMNKKIEPNFLWFFQYLKEFWSNSPALKPSSSSLLSSKNGNTVTSTRNILSPQLQSSYRIIGSHQLMCHYL